MITNEEGIVVMMGDMYDKETKQMRDKQYRSEEELASR